MTGRRAGQPGAEAGADAGRAAVPGRWAASAHADRAPVPGVWIAAVTALVSGISVFVNDRGVHAIVPAAAYTSAKNLVAALVLAGVSLAAARRRATGVGASAARRWVARPTAGPSADRGTSPGRCADQRMSADQRTSADHRTPAGPGGLRPAHWLALGYVGVVGGGLAFVLFFDGLADTAATPAAFLHDGLVVWVALLAVPLLGERLRAWNVAAIALLMVGQVAVLGGVGHPTMSRGDLLVLAATWLWAVEVVVGKRLLAVLAPSAVSLVRMGIGSIVLLAYLGATGTLHVLGSLSPSQLGWAGATGILLAAYVATWMTALSRARAVDVTAVLVGSTVVTSLLSATTGTIPVAPAVAGLALITLGVAICVRTGARRVPA